MLKLFILFFLTSFIWGLRVQDTDRTKCPQVRPLRHFELEKMLGLWYVIQYYASSEEAPAYRCMEATLTSTELAKSITMNFTYKFVDDPLEEALRGNITWTLPDAFIASHWTHSEDTYEGVYNTYVLDSDYTSWALLLHCAEKEPEPRYLSSFIMSRHRGVAFNVVAYLRDKLPRYGVDLEYVFDVAQNDCETKEEKNEQRPPMIAGFVPKRKSHPLGHPHSHK